MGYVPLLAPCPRRPGRCLLIILMILMIIMITDHTYNNHDTYILIILKMLLINDNTTCNTWVTSLCWLPAHDAPSGHYLKYLKYSS